MGDKARVIGLTGNAACGKSTVARFLGELGVAVIDADQVSREVMQPGAAAGIAVEREFGTLDRALLRETVFKDAAKRKKLEAILHPAIQVRSRELIAQALAQGSPLVVYEATLIIEGGGQRAFEGLLVVTCPEVEQKRRILERDPTLSTETAEEIIAAQLPQSEKARAATWVIDNDGSLEDLRSKVSRWHSSVARRVTK